MRIPPAQFSGQAIIFGSKWPHSIDRVLGTEKEGRFDIHPAAVNRVDAAAGNAGVRRAVVGDDARSESNLCSANE